MPGSLIFFSLLSSAPHFPRPKTIKASLKPPKTKLTSPTTNSNG